MNKLTDYLYLFKNALDDEFCDEIIKTYTNKNEWVKHQWSNYEKNISKNQKELSNIHLNEKDTKKLIEIQSKLVNSYFERYVSRTGFPPSGQKGFSLPRINRYDVETKMDIHTDNITGLFDAKMGSPILTILASLNRMNEYVGGELILFDDLKINLDKGDILIFPSAFMFPHRVEKITKGERWSIVTWTV